MYDKVSVRQISKASVPQGLNPETLSQKFTEAYTEILTLKLRLNSPKNQGIESQDVINNLDELKRIATLYEAYITLLSDRGDKRTSAFIAATAHHICISFNRVILTEEWTELSFSTISPEISATLLFMIGDFDADAANTTNLFKIQEEDTVENTVIKAIKFFATGNLSMIQGLSNAQPIRNATEGLYKLILDGLKKLSIELLQHHSFFPKDHDSAMKIFQYVKGLCTESIFEFDEELDLPPLTSNYPGPLHLVSLLIILSEELPLRKIVDIPTPEALPSQVWQSFLKKLANIRPFLWRNHLEAINRGYLEPSVSAVVSFPTGAGKTTLSELKIAATVLNHKRVIVLAPTKALVSQTRLTLESIVIQAIGREFLDDQDKFNGLKALTVLTPEACLAEIGADSSRYQGVGLIVFDECHLLTHTTMQDRRPLDAMLCVLNLVSLIPEADMLFSSAMMSNTSEIAKWLAELTGRPCLPLDLAWKPTRQVRGCLTYQTSAIENLERKLRKEKNNTKTKTPSAAFGKTIAVRPFGYFSLLDSWRSDEPTDFKFLPLSDTKFQLATSKWKLTPNANKTAAELASLTVKNALKTIVFCHSIKDCHSVMRHLNSSLTPVSVQLTEEELELYDQLVKELGSAELSQLKIIDGYLISPCLTHHGLLLPEERALHESLFRRKEGAPVICATSTLAQGMNLPADVVIINGHKRYIQHSGIAEPLPDHELLNAAGRAGRAGYGSCGLVLIIPSHIVHFDSNEDTTSGMGDIRSLFANNDNCLVIEDPLTTIFEEIYSNKEVLSSATSYLMHRLPSEESGEATTKLLSKSLCAFKALNSERQDWLETRLQSLLQRSRSIKDARNTDDWANVLSESFGLPAEFVQNIGNVLVNEPPPSSFTVTEALKWMFGILIDNQEHIFSLFRPESINQFLKNTAKQKADDITIAEALISVLQEALNLWMQGETLEKMNSQITVPVGRSLPCNSARRFIIGVIPELVYIFSLPARIWQSLIEQGWDLGETPLTLRWLSELVLYGYDTVEKLALSDFKTDFSRLTIHALMNNLEPYLSSYQDTSPSYSEIKRNVERAYTLYKLEDF